MKWFKHYSDAADDEVLSALRDKFGNEGYGVWWILIETISKQITDSPRDFVEYSEKKWRQIIGISLQKLQKVIDFMVNQGKITVEKSEKDKIKYLKIRVPKILEIADEYTKKVLTKKESASIDTRQIIAVRDGLVCQYCNKEIINSIDLHIDHIIPRIKGGKDTFNNLVLACQTCNESKGTQLPQDIGFLFPVPRDYQRIDALKDLLDDPQLLGEFNDIFDSEITTATIEAYLDIIKSNFEKKPPRLNKTRLDKTSSNQKKKEEIIFNFSDKLWKNITPEDINQWKEAYPACDVELELKRMREWLLSNPDKRKKKYRRFITNWLSRSQERGGNKGGNRYGKTQLAPVSRRNEFTY